MITPLGSSSVPGTDNPADDEALAAHAEALASAVEQAIPGWVARCVAERADQWRPGLGSELADSAATAGRACASHIGARVRALLQLDVDAQPTGPLAILRDAVSYPTEVLGAAGVPGVVRDDFAERAFPGDVYDLAPASFADIDASLLDPGLVWGAARAHVVLARRRR